MTDQRNKEITVDATGIKTKEKGKIELGQSTEQEYSYAKSSERLIAIVNESLEKLTQDEASQQQRSQIEVSDQSLRKLQLNQRNSTVLGHDGVTTQHFSQKSIGVGMMPKEANVTFQRQSSQKSGEYVMINPQNLELRYVKKDDINSAPTSEQQEAQGSIDENSVVQKNPDLEPIMPASSRSSSNSKPTLSPEKSPSPPPQVIIEPVFRKKLGHFTQTQPFSPRSINVTGLATLQHSKQNLVNATKSFPRRKVRHYHRTERLKSDRFSDNRNILGGEITSMNTHNTHMSVEKENSSRGSPIPSQLEWITNGANSREFNQANFNIVSDSAERRAAERRANAFVAQAKMLPVFTAVKQTFLGFKKRAQNRDSPKLLQMMANKPPFQNKIKKMNQDASRKQSSNAPSRATSKRPKLKLVMPTVDSAISASQKSHETRAFGTFNLETESASYSNQRGRVQTQSRQRVVPSNVCVDSLGTQSKQMPESVKNLGANTQASEFNLRADTNRGVGGALASRITEFMNEQQISQQRMVQSTQEEHKTETTPMETNKHSAIADPKLMSVRKMSSGAETNSPLLISDHKSSVMIKNVSRDAKQAKYEYCIESPKLSVQSLENQQSKPFEVTITKIPPQEMDDEDQAHEPPPITRRSSAPQCQNDVAMQVAQVVTSKVQHSRHVMMITTDTQPRDSLSPNSNSIDTKTQQTTEDEQQTVEIHCAGRQMIWSPKSTKRLWTQENAWLRPGEKIRLEHAGYLRADLAEIQQLPNIYQKPQQRSSIYSTDRNRIANLFTNQQRLAAINDPKARISDVDRCRLPKDMSEQAHINKMLPSMIKPKAVRREVENPTLGQMAFIQNNSFLLIEQQRNKSVLSPRPPQQAPFVQIQDHTQHLTHRQLKPRTPANQKKPFTPMQGAARKSLAAQRMQRNSMVCTAGSSRNQNKLLAGGSQRRRASKVSPPSRDISPVIGNRDINEAPLATNSSTDANNVNYSNLADTYQGPGSRLQKQVLEELDVIRTADRTFNNSKQQDCDEELPEVASTVKEWLKQDTKYKDLVLKKHQEVLAKRVISREETYKGKQQLENPIRSPIRVNINSRISNKDNAAQTKSITKESTIGQEQPSMSIRNEDQAMKMPSQYASLNRDLDASTLSREQNYDQTPNIDVRGEGTRNSKINNRRTDHESPRAASSRAKQNLMINMPRTPLEERVEMKAPSGQGAESQLLQSNLNSGVGLGIGPTSGEALSNTGEDISEGLSLYKSGGGKTANLKSQTAGSRNEHYSKKRSNIETEKSRKNDFQVTVQSQKVNGYQQERQRTVPSKSPPSRERVAANFSNTTRVPRLRNIDRPSIVTGRSELHGPNNQYHPGLRLRPQDTVNIDTPGTNLPQTMRSIPSQLSNAPDLIREANLPAPLFSGRNNLLESSKESSTRSPSHQITGSVEASSYLERRFRNTHLQQSLDTDRKILVNCLREEETHQTPLDCQDSKVLTRLLKGQDPLIKSGEDTFLLDLQDVTSFKKTQLESRNCLDDQVSQSFSPKPDNSKTTLLFHLNTLYSLQARAWQKYDEQYAQFEADHVKTAAPIPSSPQFLLVHLIQKLKVKSYEIELQLEARSSLDSSRLDSISSPKLSRCRTPKSRMMEKVGKTIEMIHRLSPDQKQMSQHRRQSEAGSPAQISRRSKNSSHKKSRSKSRKGKVKLSQKFIKPKKAYKMHGTDQVSLEILNEAFRQAKIQLQMAQTSVLYKFNDDDRRIFAQYRGQLCETYEKLKASNSIIQPL